MSASGSAPGTSAGASRTSGVAAFTFAIPATGGSDTVRSPLYVSLKTRSFVILTDGADPQIINLDKSSPSCHTINAGGSLSCAIDVKTSAGTHDFTVTAYSNTNGRDHALSTNSTGPIVVKAGAATPIAITLEGIVAQVVLTLATISPPSSSAAVIPLTAVLEDAEGAIIVGTAPFNNPITLTSSDTANGPLSKTVLTSPADETGISVKYNGVKVPSITYAATGSGLTAANVTVAELTPTGQEPGAGKIYVTTSNQAGTGSVLTYDAAGVPIIPTILVRGPAGVAVNADGKIYVAHVGSGYDAGGSESTYNPDGTPSTPTITGLIGGPVATAIALGPGGSSDGGSAAMYLGYFDEGSYDGTVFAYDAQGGYPYGLFASLYANSVLGIAVGANGQVYVAWGAYLGDSSVRTYNAGGGPAPTINYSYPAAPNAVAVDAAGKIYVADGSSGTVTVYNADGSPTTPHITTGLNAPQGLAVDAAGKIYVLNAGNNTITTYKPDGSQTTPTISVPGGSHLTGIAVH